MATRKAEELQKTLILGADEVQAELTDSEHGRSLVATGPALAPGARIDHYVIEDKLGAGGMGVVYKARDTLLERRVALKVLPTNLCQSAEHVRRFAREAQMHARIDSPHVATVHALTESVEGLVLIMEYLDGETLQQRLHRKGPLSAKKAIRVFDQAALGVEHIHLAGIIHQDLKPANIFITHDGRVKLLDLGVARLMNGAAFETAGTLTGTLLYMSPEQIKGRQVDHRCDIYTLGISLFEAVTGRLPFERKTNYALMHAHVQENPPPPSRFQTEIPSELEKLILLAIAKEPERRFQTISAFREALARRRPRPHFRSRPALAAPAGTAHTLVASPSKRMLAGSLGVDIVLFAAATALALYLGLSADSHIKHYAQRALHVLTSITPAPH